MSLLSSTALAQTIAMPEAQQSPPAATDSGTTGDIVVTAQRREEGASKVPISIATYSQAQMDRQGIRKIDDIARLTPALTFNNTAGVNANNGTNIAIRGVASEVGSATTAVYIDDTPIQIRNIGYLGGNPYPRVFDLERVEILRGPQGTLFGASAEGGAVRFISAQPRFDTTSIYARIEGSTIDRGSQNYEGGVAVGGPLAGNFAVRASGWIRKDGGYIDQVTPQTETVVAHDVNSQRTYVGKVAVSWRPVPELTITPAVY
ncbi:MAG TPA: TonB-dependent receptor plug domain-containing protein, partial [Sphingomonas sp.]|nr:TonB-dependent receptor plug domain-containing protein [Sphingomonas sp.]